MNSSFFAGIVEGFYGRPWTPAQRHRLFGWMRAWGLSTYFYTPKDDLKHRTRWRLISFPTLHSNWPPFLHIIVNTH